MTTRDRDDHCDPTPTDPTPVTDGIVEGTSGDDLIDIAYTGDPEGDMIDSADGLDDIVYAGGGNDTVLGGEGNDTIYGDTGEVSVTSSEVFSWADLSDTDGGYGTVDNGEDLDGKVLTQDVGSVTLTITTPEEGDGCHSSYDSVDSDFSTTAINTDGVDGASSCSALKSTAEAGESGIYEVGFSEEVQNVTFNITDIDANYGEVTVRAYDAEGNPVEVTFDLGCDLTLTDGTISGTGTDSVSPTADSNTATISIAGPVSSIEIIHENTGTGVSAVYISDIAFDAETTEFGEGEGDDTLFGEDGDDVIYGQGGHDTLYAGAGSDIVDGGTGYDTIYGGGENDVLIGGDDADTIYVSMDDVTNGVYNTTVHGGDGGDDWDTLDFSDMLADGWVITHEVQNTDSDGNGYDGQIQLYNADLDATANINYTNIEEIVPCFTPGTYIATPRGEVLVENLKVGDKVITRDNGLQPIRWIGKKIVSRSEMSGRVDLAPVQIRQGALGAGLPERDMVVSPNHRMLVSNEKAALLFDEHEVLVAAKHLTRIEGVERIELSDVTYIHIMFDRHEVVLSDGTWSESFQPGDYTLAGIGDAAREEIFTLFPELAEVQTRGGFSAARRILRKHEADLLIH